MRASRRSPPASEHAVTTFIDSATIDQLAEHVVTHIFNCAEGTDGSDEEVEQLLDVALMAFGLERELSFDERAAVIDRVNELAE